MNALVATRCGKLVHSHFQPFFTRSKKEKSMSKSARFTRLAVATLSLLVILSFLALTPDTGWTQNRASSQSKRGSIISKPNAFALNDFKVKAKALEGDTIYVIATPVQEFPIIFSYERPAFEQTQLGVKVEIVALPDSDLTRGGKNRVTHVYDFFQLGRQCYVTITQGIADYEGSATNTVVNMQPIEQPAVLPRNLQLAQQLIGKNSFLDFLPDLSTGKQWNIGNDGLKTTSVPVLFRKIIFSNSKEFGWIICWRIDKEQESSYHIVDSDGVLKLICKNWGEAIFRIK